MAKLLIQQEDLKSQGVTRNVLILVDDVVLTSKAEDQLSHCAMRGRHFNIPHVLQRQLHEYSEVLPAQS